MTVPRDAHWALTGASGFIGRALSSAIRASGGGVRGLTRRAELADGVEVVRGELSDTAALAQLVSGAGVVVHLAAYVHRDARTEEERRECRRVNVDGTAALLDAVAREASRPFFIFVSTANVYGPSDALLNEDARCAPVTEYGRTKREAELLVLDRIARGDVRGAVLRPAMVFAPGAPGHLGLLIRMVRTRVVIEIDRGRQRKTLVPLQNVLAACVAVAATQPNGAVYNVGGAVMTMREITAVIASVLGVRPLRVPLPLAAARAGARLADALLGTSAMRVVQTYASDAMFDDARLRALPGFEPVIDVDAALRAAIRRP